MDLLQNKYPKKLNKPLTLVEHWFRNDSSFAIPDEDVWFALKELLNIQDNSFDKSITEIELKDNCYEKSGRCYCDYGISPTVTTECGNEKVIVDDIYHSCEPRVYENYSLTLRGGQG